MAKQTRRDQLSRLVRERREEMGLSMSQLVAACDDSTLNSSWISRLETVQVKDIPRESRLAAIAKGLGLSYQTIARAAAAQFLGVEEDAVWSGDGTVRAVVDRMGELSEQDRRELAAIAELFSRRHNSDT
jgi:transcriptional regulator with XRE-family HTH domain